MSNEKSGYIISQKTSEWLLELDEKDPQLASKVLEKMLKQAKKRAENNTGIKIENMSPKEYHSYLKKVGVIK